MIAHHITVLHKFPQIFNDMQWYLVTFCKENIKWVGKHLKHSKQCLLLSSSAHLSSTIYLKHNMTTQQPRQIQPSSLCNKSARSINPIALHWISQTHIAYFLILHSGTNWLSFSLTSFFHFLWHFFYTNRTPYSPPKLFQSSPVDCAGG